MATNVRRSSRLVEKVAAVATVEAIPAIDTSIADATSKAQGQKKQKRTKQATIPTIPEKQSQNLHLEISQKPSRRQKGLKAAKITTEENEKSADSNTVATGKKMRMAKAEPRGMKDGKVNSETQVGKAKAQARSKKAEKAKAQAEAKLQKKMTEESMAEAVAQDKGIEQSTAVSLGKKRKVDRTEDAATASVIKSKRARKTGQKNDAEMNGEETLSTQKMALTTPRPPINRTDPCLLFPTEVWHQILSLLPLSQVARISMVSMSWLDGSRSYPAWKITCQNNKALGEPKTKYRSYMALVCSRSCWICDRCYSFSPGRARASDIPLPVANADDGGSVWQLCHACRLEYYNCYPEPSKMIDDGRDWQGNKVTKTDTGTYYHLTEVDLLGLQYQRRRNPHYRNAPPMKLYNRYDVQELALRVHGGWVGIESFSKSIAKKRSAACKERELGFRIKAPAHPKKSNNPDSLVHLEQNTEGDQGQIQVTAEEQTQVTAEEQTQVTAEEQTQVTAKEQTQVTAEEQTQVMKEEQTEVVTDDQMQVQTVKDQTQIKIEVLTQVTKQEQAEMKINEHNSTEAWLGQT